MRFFIAGLLLLFMFLFLGGCAPLNNNQNNSNTITGMQTTGGCPSGMKLGKDIFGVWCNPSCNKCVQEKCPAGIGRNYAGHCSCWEREWKDKNGKPLPEKVTCRDKDRKATHCADTPDFGKLACPCPEGQIEGSLGTCMDACKDSQCAENHKCDSQTNQCVPITCECGEIKNRACKPHECCQDWHCKKPQTACDVTKGSPTEHTCIPGERVCQKLIENGPHPKKLDLVMLIDHFPKTSGKVVDDPVVMDVVNAAVSSFLSTEPYQTYENVFNVLLVAEYGDYGCKYTAVTPQVSVTVCDPEKIKNAVSKCPDHQFVYVLTKLNPSRASAGSGYAVGELPQAMIHEVGHLLGLGDEYIPYGGIAPSGVILPPNCDSASTCEKWKNIPGTECHKGCNYEDWYRPSKDSLMNHGTEGTFNVPSIEHLKKELGKYK